MNENQDLNPEPAVAEQNVERLVSKAYQPEVADAEFVQRLEAQLCATAVEAAQVRAVAGSTAPRRSLPVRWRLACVLGAAAALAALTTAWHFRDTNIVPDEPRDHSDEPRSHSDIDKGTKDVPERKPRHVAQVPISPEWLTARPRQPAPKAATLAVGQTARTGAGQRLRLALSDGSVLYLNQNTLVKLDAERRVELTKGEVFVEVAPRSGGVGRPAPNAGSAPDADGATFIVQAPGRQATALGTKFAVRADKAGADVVVTQGQVKVSDLDRPLLAGQELYASQKEPAVAPRASHRLDWTKELMEEADSPLVPASQYAGGALVAVDPYGQESRLSLRKYHVDVHIEDGFARTTIDQTYFNHTTARLEGTFYFPLPPDASLSRLAMYVDGNLMEGGMAERDHARTVYESIVKKMQDPALLEWVDGSTFKMRVFPLEGRQEKRIILSYSQRLATLYGQTAYRFPSGHSLDVVRDWSCHLRVQNGAKLEWTSDSHSLKATQKENDLILDARASDVKLDRDLTLKLFERERTAEAKGVARWSSADHEIQHYLMLRYRPTLPIEKQKPKIKNHHWVFLFESSGDRDPLLARVQIDVIRTLLANAEHDDTFAIVTAGSRSQLFKDRPQAATAENVEATVKFLERTHLIGGLDLGRGFSAAADLLKAGKNAYLVHVGSALPTLGERREQQLLDRLPEDACYVGVGVGKRWNRALMKQAAERSGGMFTQINPDEPVKWRAFELYSTLSTPRLVDVKVVDNAERASFLTYSNAVAQGEELCAITRVDKELPESVTISGKLDGKPYRKVVKVADVAGHADYLPRTWAKLEIDRLLPEANRDPKGTARASVIALSKAMYVMTPFTSLLVLENEAMYKQFNVDRGRKDHWAMYPCPQKIKVVRELVKEQKKIGDDKKPAGKPSAEEVLKTILVRVPPAMLGLPNPPRRNDLKVIPLVNADAVEAAKALDAAFNGPRWTTAGQNPFGPGGFYSRFGGADTHLPAPNPGRIRVIGDRESNSLIVLASEGDLYTIRSLLEKSIDMGSTESSASIRLHGPASGGVTGQSPYLSLLRPGGSPLQNYYGLVRPEKTYPFDMRGTGTTDSSAIAETHVIMLKAANATEVAALIKDVYREKMNNNPLISEVGGYFPGFRFGGFGNHKDKIAVGVDVKTNSLIVHCAKGLYDDISKLSQKLDESASANRRTVRVAPVGSSGPPNSGQNLGNNAGFNGGFGGGFNNHGNAGFNGGFGNNAGTFYGNKNGNNAGLNNGNFGFSGGFGNGGGIGSTGLGSGISAATYAGRRKIVQGKPYLASYAVPSGQAERLAKTLTSVYKDSLSTTITAAGPNKIIVWAMPDDHIDIGKHVEPDLDDAKAELIRLNVLDADKLATTLQSCFPGDAKVGGPFIEADTLNNAIRIRGTKEQVAEVKATIEAFGEGKLSISGLTDLDSVITSAKRGGGRGVVIGGIDPQLVQDAMDAVLGGPKSRTEQVTVTRPLLDGRGSGWQLLFYQRPTFGGDNRIFLDLVAYAPGMNTSEADILAVLEAETAADPRTAPGVIDEKARKLIDKARRAGWQTVIIPGADGDKALTVQIDGSGRFAFERVLPLGLREQVVCDGKTLWHLYPELGIGARRVYSRFHRQAFADLAPWLMPPIEELARGADVKWIDERTVAISVARPESSKGVVGKSTTPFEDSGRATLRTHLIFAADGRLCERQLVLAPAGKVLSRETYAADGTVRRLNGDGKELAVVKLVAKPGKAVNLTPNTKEMVILPLPARTREHLLQTWTKGNAGQFAQMDEADALAFLAADLLTGSDYARQNITDRFLARTDCRPGFYVLAAAAGIDVSALPRFKNLTTPVMLYLQWMTGQPKDRPHKKLPDVGDGLLTHLAEFRAVLEPWQQQRQHVNEAEYQRLVKYIRSCHSPMLTWAVVDAVLAHPNRAVFGPLGKVALRLQVLEAASKALADVPELSYLLRYETARALLQRGDRLKARAQFEELYGRTLKEGRLLPIDADFRRALSGERGDDPAWGRLMRQTAHEVIGKPSGDEPPGLSRRYAVLGLAQQCERVGDPALAEELLDIALDGVSAKDRLQLTLAGIEWLCSFHGYDRADALLQPLLADKPASEDATLWRLAARIASARREPARSFSCLEKALELEYRRAGVTDLEGVRNEYGALLAHYEARANALATLEQKAPREFVARVVRAADRWRSLDGESAAPCEAAATILDRLGSHDLAWDYLTTALNQRPDQSPDWASVAQTWRQNGALEIADRAYAAAADLQPDNAQVVWDRAQMLETTGKTKEARRLFQRIADGQWAEQYDGLKARARMRTGER
jgi:tetratricopeptide (TPR) repeat protein